MYKNMMSRIINKFMLSFLVVCSWSSTEAMNSDFINRDEKIESLREQLPIVRCGFQPSKYERILLTKLRDKNTTMQEFRHASHKLGEQLVEKVVECLATTSIDIETPVAPCKGEKLAQPLDLVSIMRSGDALLETFLYHFHEANISKILVQRDEETAEPVFKYMKLSSTLANGHPVIITEPMVATGGTLGMVIQLLKDQGVQEDNIIIVCICAAPEGLMQLGKQFPGIHVVMSVLDERLNEKKYIVPGLGDFGDRYFGTIH
jgi:uracil phosphoribosyltransferase